MTTRTFEQFVDCVAHWECHLDEGEPGPIGIYSDTPGDAGGPTKFGVTIATLSAWRATQGLPPATPDDVKAMTLDTATEVYWSAFFTGPALDRLPTESLLALEVFDIGVGSGPSDGIRVLQETLQAQGYPVAVDGVINTDRSQPSQTATAAAKAWAGKGGAFVVALINRRIELYQRIVANDPSQAKFLDGWKWRADRLLIEAHNTGPGGVMLAANAPPIETPTSDDLNDDPALTGV